MTTTFDHTMYEKFVIFFRIMVFVYKWNLKVNFRTEP